MAATVAAEQKAPGKFPDERMIVAPEERREAVVRVIRSARQRLLLSMFRCTDYLILDELAEAIQRQVHVAALLTPRVKTIEAKKLKELGVLLAGMGAEVYRYSDPIVKYHAKYVVADDGPAMVASLNFTDKCFTNTCDFLLVTHEPGIVSGLQQLFHLDSVSPEGAVPENLSDRLIVGPDRARAQLTALLEQARRSIRIIDHKLTDPSMVALLKDKKDAGVDVAILGSGELGGLRSHGKMLLVDDQVAVIGSIALAPMSLDFRREVAVVIREPRSVGQLNRFFQTMAVRAQAPHAGAGTEDGEEED